SRRPRWHAATRDHVLSLFEKKLAHAAPGRVQALHDRKDLFRQLLRELGGVSIDELRREFKKVLALASPTSSARLYDLRGAVTTDLKDAGVDVIIRLYVTGHTLRGEILAHYESQDLHRHMQRYFQYIAPLLSAIAKRAGEVGIAAVPTAQPLETTATTATT